MKKSSNINDSILIRALILGIAGGAISQLLKAVNLFPPSVASSLGVFCGVALGYWLPPVFRSWSLIKWIIGAFIIASLYFVLQYFLLRH